MVKDAAVLEFEDAVIVRNLVARSKEGTNFPSQKALDAYMAKHPKADKSKHKVVDKTEETTREIFKKMDDWHKKGPGALSPKDEKAMHNIMKRVNENPKNDKYKKKPKDDDK